MPFTKLTENSRKFLEEIVLSNIPLQTLCNRFDNASRQEKDELHGILKELQEAGYIKVIWANNMPYSLEIYNSGKTYEEQLTAFQSQNLLKGVVGMDTLKEKICDFIQRGERIMEDEYHDSNGFLACIGGPQSDVWFNDIDIYAERHLLGHPLYTKIKNTCDKHKRLSSAHRDMIGYLKSIAADNEFIDENAYNHQERMCYLDNKKVFIVHGHDNEAVQMLARTLEKGGFKAIILHEQPDAGMTIIEKIERLSDVSFAVVLYTECDLGRAREDAVGNEQFRARQNVVFEHGYLIGKLNRDHVCALVKGNVETPGDISGIVYIPMDAGGAWKMHLAKNMQNVGLPVDMNTFCT